MYQLEGKTYLVTGASSGIGRETAHRLAEENASAFLIGRNSEQLDMTAAECRRRNPNGSYQPVVIDLESEESVKNGIEGIGRLNGVFLAAGKIEPFPVAFLSRKKIDSVMHANFYSVALITGLLLKTRKLLPESSLVFISSISSEFPHIGGGMYSASKAAIEAYARTLALEYAQMKIRANVIAPGMIRTPLYEQAETIASKETMDAHIKRYPLGVGYPSDVANLAMFLFSEQSRWMTGNTIMLDGGLHLGA